MSALINGALHVDMQKILAPYHQQARILAAEQRYLLFLAGIGAGKTYTGAAWAIMHMLCWSPGYRGAILGRTEKKDAMDQLATRVLELLDRFHAETGLQLVRKFDKLNNILTLINGSSAVFRGFIQYDKLRGPEYAWVWLDELFFSGVDDGDVFDVVDGRVRIGTCKQVLITCSPRGVTPVIRRFGDAQDRAVQTGEAIRYFVVRATSYDNPHLDRQDIAAWRENMSTRRAAQEIDGEILKPEHVVFPELDERHLVDFDWRTAEHRKWPWVLAVDWGDTKGCVALDIRVNPITKQWVVADELVPQASDLPDGRLNQSKFRTLLADWLKRKNSKPLLACADRAVVTENGFLRRLLAGETQVITMETSSEQRVNNGLEMLRDAFDPPGRPPRIVFAKSLAAESRGETPGIRPSILAFRWEVDKAGFPKPVVVDNEHKHSVDALRYGWVGARRDSRLHLTLPAMYGLGPDGYSEPGDGQHSKQDRF